VSTVRTVAGIALIILGIIGSLLPVIPGIVFFAAAIAVLGTDHAIVQKIVALSHRSDHPYMRKFRDFLRKHGILKAQT